MHFFLNKWRLPFNNALRVLLATNALILVGGAMLGPIYAFFVEEVGGDILDAGFAGAVFALAAGLTVLWSGNLTDKVKQGELVIAIGYAIMGLGFILYIFVNSIWFLLLVQVVVGLGEAIYNPAFDAVYSRHLDRNKYGSEWGAWESMSYFTTAVGAALGGFIVKFYGFDVLFVIMATFCLSTAVYIFFLPRKVL